MSDEQHPSGMQEPDDAAGGMGGMAEKASASPMSQMGDFSTGEGLVALGGMIILGVWLIFEVITDDYGMSHLMVVLAATAVLLPRVNREIVEGYHSLSRLMKAVGYGIALTGVSEIVSDVEGGLFGDAPGTTIIAALLAYVGFAVAFQGARTTKV